MLFLCLEYDFTPDKYLCIHQMIVQMVEMNFYIHFDFSKWRQGYLFLPSSDSLQAFFNWKYQIYSHIKYLFFMNSASLSSSLSLLSSFCWFPFYLSLIFFAVSFDLNKFYPVHHEINSTTE